MKNEELIKWMEFCNVKGIGSSKLNKLLAMFNNINEFYLLSRENLLQTRVFNENMVNEFYNIKKTKSSYFRHIIEDCKRNNIKIIPFYSKEYPKKLKIMPDAPLTLFAKGNIKLLKNRKIAIVGSRESSEEAKQWAFKISENLVEKNLTIVSGGAKGIDYSAHKGTLEKKGNTICVIGSGFFNLYPKEHKKLFEEIEKKGLMLSEHPPNYEGSRISLLRRNRIISGMSDGLILVTSSSEGGSISQLKIAYKQKIPIFSPLIKLNFKPNEGIKESIKDYNIKEISNIEQVIKEINKSNIFSYC